MKNFLAFEVEGHKYGIVVGKEKMIVTQDEFIHWVDSVGKSQELFCGLEWSAPDIEGKSKMVGEKYTVISFDEIKSMAMPLDSFKGWAHYWGIKDRIEYNYGLLLDSMKKIGVDISDMPKWGK